MGVGCASHLHAEGEFRLRVIMSLNGKWRERTERENGEKEWEKQRMLDIRVRDVGYEAYGGVGNCWELADHGEISENLGSDIMKRRCTLT